ncbi:hypothetical protein R5R35_006871 [Gryllus longicercus]|uniref:Transcription factor CBF/NF-Y/archaeal histone domain-containing protein n=1 Tax=Gryllus longicercus TaxID=2509291 RepID=A0AAN9VP75_9ORTH
MAGRKGKGEDKTNKLPESSGRKGKREDKTNKLPESRVKIIMKSSPATKNIGKDALFLANIATKMFIQHLTKSAYSISNNKDELNYNDIAEIVQTKANMSFVKEMMPRTITLSQYKELMAAKGLTIEYESSEDESDETGSTSSQEQSFESSSEVY